MTVKKILTKFVCLSIIIGCVLFYKSFEFEEISGVSMSPTLSDRDMVISKETATVTAGDIVIIKAEDQYATDSETKTLADRWRGFIDPKAGKLLIKRVVGVAGDHIVINDTGFYINDILQDEDYLSDSMWYETSKSVDLTVPDGEIFVLGDNRTVSMDSRYYGTFPLSNVQSKMVFDFTKIGLSFLPEVIALIISFLFILSSIKLIFNYNPFANNKPHKSKGRCVHKRLKASLRA